MNKNDGKFKPGHHWREPRPWWNKKWLYDQYIVCQRSASEIAQEAGITENAILYWLHKHKIKRRTISEARAVKHWGASGSDNPMWNKFGELNPNWKGGVTSERQAFYISQEWKDVCSATWKRDNATCQRCGLHKDDRNDMPFHIHHIVTFANEELRADIDNLVLLCEACHQFVHSSENTEREFLPKV